VQKYNMFPTTDSLTITPPTDEQVTLDIPCRRCGSCGPHVEGRGTGPHRAKLVCADCGVFLRWLPTHSPENRIARAEYYRRLAQAQQSVTHRQRAFLLVLGHKGAEPKNRLEASEAIDALLGQRRGRL
jgi:hypothetical protein